jgi:hypothetical protein
VERPLIDYEKSMKDLKLNSMYGTLKQVRLNAMDIVNTGNRTKNLEKRVDDMFISNNAKIAAMMSRRCLWTVSNSTLLEDARMRRRWIAKPSDP